MLPPLAENMGIFLPVFEIRIWAKSDAPAPEVEDRKRTRVPSLPIFTSG
jgi:hypothetical protein